jgi:transketolase
MRKAFVEALAELARKDERIILLTADLGFAALEPFAEEFPRRFFNVGVCEQNMVGLATGLAEAGFIPYTYSITPFSILRPYEFIRNGPIVHKFPVRIVGMGGGFEYGHNGISHYALEDIAVMRTQPGITIIAPADYEQTSSAILATWNLPGPVYYRLGKNDNALVEGLNGRFEMGRAELIGEGKDVVIITMGSIAHEAITASKILSAHGLSSKVMIIAGVSPAPVNDLINTLNVHELAITLEAHYIAGGLGSLVAEVIAEQRLSCKLVRFGVKDADDGISGSTDFLHRKYGLDGESVAKAICDILRRSNRKDQTCKT